MAYHSFFAAAIYKGFFTNRRAYLAYAEAVAKQIGFEKDET